MKYKSIILSTLILFVVMTGLFSLYEGSALTDNPEQWKYTAVFSQMMNGGEIMEKSAISQLDYFLYAIKFRPFFPSSMVVFILLIIFTAVFPFIHKNKSRLVLAVYLLLFISSLFVQPAEQGTAVFLGALRYTSLLLFCFSALILLKNKNFINRRVVNKL
ncbi:DUF4306 domain-containing protein [Rossellomorea vietnamensis]|uniref:DUF4306 domain-containing protein n=1 Tax=Rossellomorea vietnamensis TaxID=218284 RepID=A0A5D4MJD8_9BACI|nr:MULTISPECIES: DUF4306 domain-containing protein [Bacillaceae]TYS01414.1 DUF4306 domain-containing protein [Rossellomorea vietnamensis]